MDGIMSASIPIDKFTGLIQSAKFSTDIPSKLENLQKLKDELSSVDNNNYPLIVNVLPQLIDLHTDRSSPVRRFVAEIAGDVGLNNTELLPDILPLLITLLRDATPAVARQAITSGISLFRRALTKIALQGLYSSEVDDSIESSWAWVLKLKDEIYSMAYQPESDGRKLLALKFVESVTLLYTTDPSASSEPPADQTSSGDTLGSFVYVPCEVIKQRMQVQGTRGYWTSVVAKDASRLKADASMYGYYSGMFQAGCTIWKDQGPKGLYAGYWSTLVRDVPFAGLMVTFYEALKDVTEYGKQKWFPNSSFQVNSTFEGLVLRGIAGGASAYLTTPLDVIKTRLQVQGTIISNLLSTLCKRFEFSWKRNHKARSAMFSIIYLLCSVTEAPYSFSFQLMQGHWCNKQGMRPPSSVSNTDMRCLLTHWLDVLMDKKPDEVPILVESVLSKVMEATPHATFEKSLI